MDYDILLNTNLFHLDNKAYINTRILETLADEKTLEQKRRFLVPFIKPLIALTDLKLEEVIIKVDQNIYVAYRIMQYLIVSLCKFLPWNDTRREYIRHHLHDSLIPDKDVFSIPTRQSSSSNLSSTPNSHAKQSVDVSTQTDPETLDETKKRSAEDDTSSS